MINMVQNAKDQAAALAMAAYQAAVADGTLPQAEVKTAPVEIPKDTANGDFTTTFALAASKALRQPPRNIAQALLDHMDLAGSYFASAEIAGPGFLNFRLNNPCASHGTDPGGPLFSESPGEMNSPSAKDFGSSKILGRAAARFAGTLSYFRFTRILKLFLPVTVCSTAMEYLISSRPPRSLRLCRRALVWISTDSSP